MLIDYKLRLTQQSFGGLEFAIDKVANFKTNKFFKKFKLLELIGWEM